MTSADSGPATEPPLNDLPWTDHLFLKVSHAISGAVLTFGEKDVVGCKYLYSKRYFLPGCLLIFIATKKEETFSLSEV
jgi:hypothetical protein